MGDANKACEIARAALKAANSQFKDCPEDIFQEAQSIMELLKDNLNVWQESEERWLWLFCLYNFKLISCCVYFSLDK